MASLDEVESCHSLLDTVAEISTLHIASMIEKKISMSPQFYCINCQTVFQENDKVDPVDSFILDWNPCMSTFKICKNAKTYFKLYDAHSNSQPRYDFKVLYYLIFRSLDFNTLYGNSKFECDINYKYQFIKCIVGQYIAVRAAQVSRDITLDQYNLISRQHFNRMILRDGHRNIVFVNET